MVDTIASKAIAERRVGSSPTLGTNLITWGFESPSGHQIICPVVCKWSAGRPSTYRKGFDSPTGRQVNAPVI